MNFATSRGITKLSSIQRAEPRCLRQVNPNFHCRPNHKLHYTGAMQPLSADTCTAFDQLSVGLAVVDSSGVVVYANTYLARVSGFGVRRLLSQSIASFDLSGRLPRAIEQACVGKDSVIHELELSFPNQTARAKVFVRLFLHDDLAQEKMVLVECHFAENDSLDATVPQAVLHAIRGIAHEIKNPLAGLRGAAQLIRKRANDVALDPYFDIIQAETTRLAELTNRLLNPAPLNPHTLVNVHEVLERVRLLAEADAAWALNIVRDYDPSLPSVLGDADRLIQAVWNLVRNAIEAGPSEIRLRTRIDLAAPIREDNVAAAIRIDVIDNGKGVPDELAHRIFMPLVSGRSDGTGLGLPIAQSIAREHGGLLSFQSRPQQTIFTLYLPFTHIEAEQTHG